MADNTARMQLWKYDQAERLAENKEYAAAHDILWDLRIDPELTLWNRVLVNLLLAATLNVRKHPDAAKFANEAIALTRELERDETDEESKNELIRMRTHALQLLPKIEKLRKDAQIGRAKTREMTPAAQPGDKNGTEQTETGTEKAQSTPDNATETSSTEIGITPWEVEGAFDGTNLRKRAGKSLDKLQAKYKPESTVVEGDATKLAVEESVSTKKNKLPDLLSPPPTDPITDPRDEY